MKDIYTFMYYDGDWEVLYVDGKLHYEGHSIPTHVWVKLLNGSDVYDSGNVLGHDDAPVFLMDLLEKLGLEHDRS